MTDLTHIEDVVCFYRGRRHAHWKTQKNFQKNKYFERFLFFLNIELKLSVSRINACDITLMSQTHFSYKQLCRQYSKPVSPETLQEAQWKVVGRQRLVGRCDI